MQINSSINLQEEHYEGFDRKTYLEWGKEQKTINTHSIEENGFATSA